MAVQDVLQVYLERLGDPRRLRRRVGAPRGRELVPVQEARGIRWNTEWIHLDKCPVGYTAVPYPVGGNGDVFHTNFEMKF